MYRRLRDLLRDGPIMEIAIGLALAYAIVNLADTVAFVIIEFWRYEAPAEGQNGTALAIEGLFARGIRIGDRYLNIAELLAGLLELAVVIAVAVLLRPRDPAGAHEAA